MTKTITGRNRRQAETVAESRTTTAGFVPEQSVAEPFTMEEHLRVQREMERRARLFWRLDGRDSSRALNHWLRAEAEVLAEFCLARHAARPPLTFRKSDLTAARTGRFPEIFMNPTTKHCATNQPKELPCTPAITTDGKKQSMKRSIL